jgi:hypothetical protein
MGDLWTAWFRPTPDSPWQRTCTGLTATKASQRHNEILGLTRPALTELFCLSLGGYPQIGPEAATNRPTRTR